MKLSPSTLVTQTKIRKVFIGFFCTLYSLLPVLALTPTTGNKEEMNLYTKAREQEEKMGTQYMADGLKGFSKKLDKAIKKDVELAKFFKKGYCDGCDSVVSPEFDQALTDYLGSVPALTKKTAYDFASVVRPHLDPSISEVSNTDIRALNTLINIMTDSIIGQTKEQMILSREIAPMGRHIDGDPDNSPNWDLMADIRSIDSKIFNELPDLWPYKNEDMSAGLIAGSGWLSGDWWFSGIAEAVDKAFGKDSLWPVKLVASSACSGGTCSLKPNSHTTDVLSNKTIISRLGESKWDSLESIFKWGDEFMTKYGINRGNPCKIAPSWFFFQWLFDVNASEGEWILKKMFSMGVYPVQEVPELLKWFMNRETRTRESEDKQIDDSVAKSLKNRWINPEKPTEILIAGIQRSVNQISRESADSSLPALAAVNAVERGEGEYEKYLRYVGKGMEGIFIKQHSLESMDHIGVAMEEMTSRARSVDGFAENLKGTTEYLGDKPECQPA